MRPAFQSPLAGQPEIVFPGMRVENGKPPSALRTLTDMSRSGPASGVLDDKPSRGALWCHGVSHWVQRYVNIFERTIDTDVDSVIRDGHYTNTTYKTCVGEAWTAE